MSAIVAELQVRRIVAEVESTGRIARVVTILVGPGGSGGGSGDVVGPASATDGAVAKFDGTTGKLLKDGGVLGTAATVDTGTGSGNAILGNDARLSDARTPTSHNHAASEITSGTIAQARLGTGSGGAGTKVLYDDQTYKAVAASGGVGFLPQYNSSLWSTVTGVPVIPMNVSVFNTAVISAGTYWYTRFSGLADQSIGRLLLEVTATALTTGQSVTVGMAEMTSAGVPDTSWLWTETVVCDSNGIKTKTGLSDRRPSNGMMVIFNPSTNAGSVTLRAAGVALPEVGTLSSIGNRSHGMSNGSGVSTLPAPTSSTSYIWKAAGYAALLTTYPFLLAFAA